MSERGHCHLCGYGPVPVQWGMVPDVEPEDEIPVCTVCAAGELVQLHWRGRDSSMQRLAVSLGRLVNALVDGEGPARREVVESLLRGEGRPSGDYDEW